MSSFIPEPLFVLEMANNHMGDVDHGIRIIREMAAVVKDFPYRFAFKLQYRDLDTFIHPAKKGRDDVKYVKRFSETRLSKEQFLQLVEEMRACGFLTMATPFDEVSVELIESQQLDFLKIASCSCTDWPLLERVAASHLPILASTAGAGVEDIDRVVSFFQHRSKDFAILHCVGEYPTPAERMNLSQIDYLKARYADVRIGFSSHEHPDDCDVVKIAVAKGALLFERHVGVATEKYALNNYSSSPEQVRKWLQGAQAALTMCGSADRSALTNPGEAASLRSLRRGVFAKRPVAAGEILTRDDVYFAFPPDEGQFTANDWSKYARFCATADMAPDEALSPLNAAKEDQREQVLAIVQDVRRFLKETGIIFPGCADLEISHHYGIEKFREHGLTMLTVVNRAYCKKLLIVMPGQNHPEQYHKEKEETFHVLHGELQLELDGEARTFAPGDVVTVHPGVRHAFSSQTGAVIEEISSTHFVNDSYYIDPAISENRNRKTILSYWMA